MPLNESSVRVKAIKEDSTNGRNPIGISFRANLLNDSKVDWYYLRFIVRINGTEEDDAFIQLADTYSTEPYVIYQPGQFSGTAFFNEIESTLSPEDKVDIYLGDVAYKQKSWYNISIGEPQGDDHQELPKLGINKEKINNQLSKTLQKLGYDPHQEKEIEKDPIAGIQRPTKYKKSKVDKITNFYPSTDTLEIDTDSFGIDSSATFASGKNKKTIKKKLAKLDIDFIYDEKKGGLYFNENGADKGFGDGGIIAILKGAPELTASNLVFI